MRVVAAGAALLLGVVACSSGDDTPAATAATTTTTSLPPAGTASTASSSTASSSTASPSPTSPPSDDPANTGVPPTTTAPATTAPGAATTVERPAEPLVAEAGGWRLVIHAPTSGSSAGRPVTVCVEATGNSREPSLALDATWSDDSHDVAGEQVPVGVGRSAVELTELPDGSGPFDLALALTVDGATVDGLEVTVTDVTLRAGAVAADCPF